MPKIQYTGGSHVKLLEISGTAGRRVAPQEVIEVSKEIYDLLIERPRWKSPTIKKSATTSVTGKEI